MQLASQLYTRSSRRLTLDFDVKILSSSESRSILTLNATFEDDLDVITVFARVLVSDVSNASTLLTIDADGKQIELAVLPSLELFVNIDE